jgi:hypothetical protein
LYEYQHHLLHRISLWSKWNITHEIEKFLCSIPKKQNGVIQKLSSKHVLVDVL